MKHFGFSDVVILIGLGLIVYGVSLLYVPAAIILAGCLLVVFGYFSSVDTSS